MSRLLRSKNNATNASPFIFSDLPPRKHRMKHSKKKNIDKPKKSKPIKDGIVVINENQINTGPLIHQLYNSPHKTPPLFIDDRNNTPTNHNDQIDGHIEHLSSLLKLTNQMKSSNDNGINDNGISDNGTNNYTSNNINQSASSKDINDYAYDPRILRTVDPNCIINNSINPMNPINQFNRPTPSSSKIKIFDKAKSKNKISNTTSSQKLIDSFLHDPSLKSNLVTDYFNSEPEFINPHYYQEYLYDDNLYTQNLQNKSFDSTSYELDSNITSHPNSTNQNDENINPVFFHNTPSPNNFNSIRIITGSNRIAKLRDKKLIQAINKSLGLKNSYNNLDNSNSNEFKTINNNHNKYLFLNSILSSPRKEINDRLNNAILSNSHSNNINTDKNTDNHYESARKRSILSNNDSHLIYNGDKDYTYAPPLKNLLNSDDNSINLMSELNQELGKRQLDYNNDIDNSVKNNSDTKHPAQKQIVLKSKLEWKQHDQIKSNVKKFNSSNDNNDAFYTEDDISSNLNISKEKCTNGLDDLSTQNRDNGNVGNLNSKDCDVVLEIFRESLKKNKDYFSKSKCQEKIAMPKPKITKLKVPKTNKSKHDSKFPASEYEEKDIFRCTQCPKVFKQRSQWKRHVDCIHLKIAKFICIRCSKAFKRSDHLKNHIRRIHGN